LADLQKTVYPHKWTVVTRKLQAERRPGKVRRSKTNIVHKRCYCWSAGYYLE